MLIELDAAPPPSSPESAFSARKGHRDIGGGCCAEVMVWQEDTDSAFGLWREDSEILQWRSSFRAELDRYFRPIFSGSSEYNIPRRPWIRVVVALSFSASDSMAD